MATFSESENFHNNNNNIEKDIKFEPVTCGSSNKRKGSAPKRIQLDNTAYFPEEKKVTIIKTETACENTLPKLTPALNGIVKPESNPKIEPYSAAITSTMLATSALDLSGMKPNPIAITVNSTIPATTQAILQLPNIDAANLLLCRDLAPLMGSAAGGLNLGSLLGLNQSPSAANGNINTDIMTALMQALLLQSHQQQQQQQQQANHLNMGTSAGLTDMTNFLRNLPVPTADLPSYPILYTQYITIVTQLQNLIRLIDQYNSGVQIAQKSAAVAQVAQFCSSAATTAGALFTPSSAASGLLLSTRPLSATTSSPSGASSFNGHTTNLNGGTASTSSSPPMMSFSTVLKPDRSTISSPDTTSVTGRTLTQQAVVTTSRTQNGTSSHVSEMSTEALRVTTNLGDDLLPAWRSANSGKRVKKLIMPGKKTNFRGTSEMENTVDPNFKHFELGNGDILLSEDYDSVHMPRDVYESILSKCSKSATRLIRLLMKHFFSQKELAESSLSGEGIYKLRLRPAVTEAIKQFIRRRHPFLKTGTMSLCMTDVCVQARRVANNQRSRGSGGRSTTNNNNNNTSLSCRTAPLASSTVLDLTGGGSNHFSSPVDGGSEEECGEGGPLCVVESPEYGSNCSRQASPALPLTPLAIPSNPNPQDMFPTDS